MLKASHYIAIALAFLVAASLRASAGERTVSRTTAHVSISAHNAGSGHVGGLPWRLVFR
jgi:hypothetical protein